jgi:hypothetical protein
MKKWILAGCLFAVAFTAQAQKQDSPEEGVLPTG